VLPLAFTLAACTGLSAPVVPSVVDNSKGEALATAGPAKLTGTGRNVNAFPLVNGSFTLTLRASDGNTGAVTGIYTGEATVSEHGTPTANLDIHITGASGIGSAVTAIEARGMRAFVDEGDFALTMTLNSSLTKSPLHVTVRGASSLSCSPLHRILVSMHGTDEARGGLIAMTLDLQHEVERTGCS
jgi:hypothetical protein